MAFVMKYKARYVKIAYQVRLPEYPQQTLLKPYGTVFCRSARLYQVWVFVADLTTAECPKTRCGLKYSVHHAVHTKMYTAHEYVVTET